MSRRGICRALAVALALVSAGPSAAATAVAALPADWDTLDPHRTRSTNGFQMAVALYDRLVALAPSGRIVPYLAERWDVADTGLTLTIRQGARCADGTPVDADVVAQSLRRLARPDTQAPYAARTFGRGEPEIRHDGAARTVTIRPQQPHSDLLLALAMPWSSIVCPAGLAEPSRLQSAAHGSGPYTLQHSARGSRYVLVRRAGHDWGPDVGAAASGLPDELVLRVSSNTSTTANLLVTGEIQLASITGREVERLARDASLRRTDTTLFGADALLFSQAAGRVTTDRRVRQALAQAIDAVGFNRAFAFGLGSPSATLTTPSMQCHDARVGAAAAGLDPARTHALLAEAGYRRNARGRYEKDGRPLRVRIAGHRGQNAGPEYLMEVWRGLGIEATLSVAEFNTWLETVSRTADWDVTVMPFNSVIPSPSLFVAQLTGAAPPKGSNFMGRENPDYAAAARAAQAAGPAERCAKWAAAERIVLESVDVQPLVARTVSTFTRGLRVQMLSGAVFDPHSLRVAP